jgi:neurexin
MDDLIFSGAGSGCRGDDEDECMPPFENGSGDDLITPVYVPPTKQTITATKSKTKENEKTCDDEDCLHGSGSGEVTDSSYTTTSVTSKTDAKGLLRITNLILTIFKNLFYFSETSPDFTSFTTIEDRRTDTTIPDTTRQDKDISISSSGTTTLQETTHLQTFGTSTTDAGSSSTSTTLGTSSIATSSTGTSSTSTTRTSTTTTTTRGTTLYVPPQTDSTIPYIVKETIPPEPSTPEHDIDNEIYHPEPHPDDYYEPHPEPPEPETEPPPVFRTPPPIFNPGNNYNNNPPTRMTPKNKHGRINTEAEVK